MTNLINLVSNSIKNWWIPLLVGIVLIALGVLVFAQPDMTYISLAFMFAIAFIFIGVAEIYFAISNHQTLAGWGWYLVGGILSLLVGGVLLALPDLSEEVLPYFVAFMLLFRSIQGLGISFDLKNNGILDWGNLAIASVLGILFSFLLLIYPLFAVAFMITLTGLAFLFVGVIGVVLGFNLKRIKDTPQRISKNLKNRIEEVKRDIQKELKETKHNVKKAINEAENG